MNKFLRIISTMVVGVGLLLLFAYLTFQNRVNSTQFLDQPSYYVLQNYWYLLAAGCGCLAFSIISSFLAWSKKMDVRVEILPNAVSAGKKELLGWLAGSSLDTNKKEHTQQPKAPADTGITPPSTDHTQPVIPDQSADKTSVQFSPAPEKTTVQNTVGTAPAAEAGTTVLPQNEDAVTTLTAAADDDGTICQR